MKDFTTAEHIKPIIEEIEQKYFIDRTTPEVKAIFKSDIVLTPADGSRNAYFITADRDTLLPNIYKFIALYQQITRYCEAVETYAGELDIFCEHEKDRARAAVYNTLLRQYAK